MKVDNKEILKATSVSLEAELLEMSIKENRENFKKFHSDNALNTKLMLRSIRVAMVSAIISAIIGVIAIIVSIVLKFI